MGGYTPKRIIRTDERKRAPRGRSSFEQNGMPKPPTILLTLGTLFCAGCADNNCVSGFFFESQVRFTRFYKGNTHIHTERSYDSTAPIGEVLNWYEQHGYDFVVVTDHDVSSQPGEFQAIVPAQDFIAIAGEEVTSRALTPELSTVPIHANSLCSNGGTVGGSLLYGPAETLGDALDRIVTVAQAVPQINHPNLLFALGAEDILAAGGAPLLEIANQSLTANNSGNLDHASTEEIWDQLLRSGMKIFGVASDDSHSVYGGSSLPDSGWVKVAAPALRDEAVCLALRSGAFYASTGVELTSLTVTETKIIVEIQGDDDDRFSTSFIGSNGELAVAVGSTVEFDLESYGQRSRLARTTPTERRTWRNRRYVRATVTDPDGRKAWIQPQFFSCNAP